MKKLLLLSIGIVALGLMTQAQDYKSAIGGRLGTTYYDVFTASYKTFITEPGALEFNAGVGGKKYDHDYRTFAVTASAAYQHHFPIGNIAGFKWYVGGGLMIYNATSDYDRLKGFGFGVFPTGGVDYKIGNIPLDVSADIRPTIFIAAPGYYNSYYSNFGIAARYTF